MNKNLGFISLVIAALIFAGDGVMVTQLSEDFGYFGISFLRFGFSLIFIVLLMITMNKSFKIPTEKIRPTSIFSIAYLVAFITFSYAIINAEKVSNVIFMMLCAAMLTTMAYGTIILKEKLSRLKLLAAFLAVLGLLFISYPFNLEISLIIGFVSGIFFGLANSYRRVIGELGYEKIVYFQSLVATVIAGLAFLILGNMTATNFSNISILTAGTAVFYGFSTVLSGLLVTYGFNNFEVNIGQVILTTELLFAIIVNYIFLLEVPNILELIGGLLIFLSTVTSKFTD